MGDILLVGDPPIEVKVKRSRGVRRLSLRVSGIDGMVSLSMPARASQREAVSFLREKEPWIRGHLDKQPSGVSVKFGAEVPVEGASYKIEAYKGRVVQPNANMLLVPSDPNRAAARVQAYLKALARDRLVEASDRYARAVGRSYGRLTLRDTRSRWGSCTSEGNLMYSWRLIMAPVEVLDYVAAHEVCHLVEMNHSKAFWNEVAGLMPEYEEPRHWLRRHGASLHRYKFVG
ncbi:MAG: SprT family zinc-dependent metalloprotease [Litoreibacter sp.]